MRIPAHSAQKICQIFGYSSDGLLLCCYFRSDKYYNVFSGGKRSVLKNGKEGYETGMKQWSVVIEVERLHLSCKDDRSRYLESGICRGRVIGELREMKFY
jgi:hypothetical protein